MCVWCVCVCGVCGVCGVGPPVGLRGRALVGLGQICGIACYRQLTTLTLFPIQTHARLVDFQ